MRRHILSGTALLCILITACDRYTYKGMDGEQALAASQDMSLPDAYDFYLETYTGTSPPMLDVAKTFRRFGDDGATYIARQALETRDSQEFEADMMALLILEYKCSHSLQEMLSQKAEALEVDNAFVADGCD